MTGSTLSLIVIPIVVVITLAGWIGAVLYAQAHPGKRKPAAPGRYTVSGGVFVASGGHQVMPHRDAKPPESGQYEDQYQHHGQGGGRPLAGQARRLGQPDGPVDWLAAPGVWLAAPEFDWPRPRVWLAAPRVWLAAPG
jgi:hypothetical protein